MVFFFKHALNRQYQIEAQEERRHYKKLVMIVSGEPGASHLAIGNNSQLRIQN